MIEPTAIALPPMTTIRAVFFQTLVPDIFAPTIPIMSNVIKDRIIDTQKAVSCWKRKYGRRGIQPDTM